MEGRGVDLTFVSDQKDSRLSAHKVVLPWGLRSFWIFLQMPRSERVRARESIELTFRVGCTRIPHKNQELFFKRQSLSHRLSTSTARYCVHDCSESAQFLTMRLEESLSIQLGKTRPKLFGPLRRFIWRIDCGTFGIGIALRASRKRSEASPDVLHQRAYSCRLMIPPRYARGEAGMRVPASLRVTTSNLNLDEQLLRVTPSN